MESISNWWAENFLSYAAQIGTNYMKNPEEVLSSLKYKSVLDCLNESYQVLVKDESIYPIEKLDQREKERLWSKAKTIGTGKDQCVLIAKCIYLLERITTNE